MGDKVQVDDITTFMSPSAIAKVNENFDKVADEFDEVVYRNGTQNMQGDLDMNSNRIYNLPLPVLSHEPLTLGTADDLLAPYVTDAQAAQLAAEAARDIAVDARDDILNNAGFITVAANLLGPNTIGTVADSITNVNTTAGSITNVNAVGSNIASVNTTAANIASVNTTATNIGAIIAAPGLVATITASLPIGISAQKAFRQQPASFSTTGSLGGGYTAAASATTYATFNLIAEDYIARTNGQLFTIKIPVVAGSITSAQLTQKNGATTVAGPTSMTIEGGYAILRGVTIHPSATLLFLTNVTAGGSGVTVGDVGVSYGEPATVQTENALRVEQGTDNDVADAVPFLRPTFYSYSILAGATPTFNSLDGLIAPLTTQSHFILAYPFETDQLYTISFISPNLPVGSSILAYTDQGFGKIVAAFATDPIPKFRKVGNYYEFSFYANNQSTYPLIGVAIRIDNVSPLTDTVTATDFRIVKGNVRPIQAKTPVKFLDDTRKATRNSLILNTSRRLFANQAIISTTGTSISAGYAGPGNPISNWPIEMDTLLTTQTVVNNAVRGAFSTGITGRWNSTPAYVTVTGGAIPSTTTPVQITFESGVDFFSGFTVADGQEPLTGYLAGVYGTFSRTAGTAYFTRSVAASAPTTASGRLPITTDIGVAASKTINIIEIGRNDEFTPNLIPRTGLPDWLMAYVERHLDYMAPIAKQLIVSPPIIGLADPDIAVRRIVDTKFKALLNNLGVPILDFNRQMTPAELSYMQTTFSYSYTGQDVTDDTNGLLPTSMRQADGLHQNLMGNRLLGYRAKNLIVELGWTP